MKKKDVVVGGIYLTYIGAALARVVVMAEIENWMAQRGHTVYQVRREGETSPLPKMRSAAMLRPTPTSVCQSELAAGAMRHLDAEIAAKRTLAHVSDKGCTS